MRTLRFSKTALKDLAGIDAYTVREWGESQADRYLRQLEDCLARVAQNPLLGRSCTQIRPGLRRIEQGKHVVFYHRMDHGIFVSRILHYAMLPRMDHFEEDA
jgi:toxin ParE1/3/4